MAVQTPNVPGMVVEDRQYANGSQHVGQFRMGGYEGGSNGTPNTATRTGVGAQGSGSATNAWVSCGGAGESVAPNVRRQIVLRGGATQDVNVLYAPNDSGFVDPPGFPSDFIGGAVAEYEMDSANPTHSVDPSVAFEATCVTAVSDVGNPGNYAGVREILIVAGDTPT
jgi:hypothetical protein